MIDTASLRKLLEAATPGPLGTERLEAAGRVFGSGSWGPDRDRRLFLSAVNALPGLLDEIERLRARGPVTIRQNGQCVSCGGDWCSEPCNDCSTSHCCEVSCDA